MEENIVGAIKGERESEREREIERKQIIDIKRN